MFESIVNVIRSVRSRDPRADAKLLSAKLFRVVVQCGDESVWQSYTATTLPRAEAIGKNTAMAASRRTGQTVVYSVVALCGRCHGSCVDRANGGDKCALCDGSGVSATVAKEYVNA